jgi:hypothetical protein
VRPVEAAERAGMSRHETRVIGPIDGAGKRARRSGPEVSTALPGRNARLAATVPLWHSSRSILGDRPS